MRKAMLGMQSEEANGNSSSHQDLKLGAAPMDIMADEAAEEDGDEDADAAMADAEQKVCPYIYYRSYIMTCARPAGRNVWHLPACCRSSSMITC